MLYILIKVQETLDPALTVTGRVPPGGGLLSLARSWLLKKQTARRGHHKDALGSPGPPPPSDEKFLSTSQKPCAISLWQQHQSHVSSISDGSCALSSAAQVDLPNLSTFLAGNG